MRIVEAGALADSRRLLRLRVYPADGLLSGREPLRAARKLPAARVLRTRYVAPYESVRMKPGLCRL